MTALTTAPTGSLPHIPEPPRSYTFRVGYADVDVSPVEATPGLGRRLYLTEWTAPNGTKWRVSVRASGVHADIQGGVCVMPGPGRRPAQMTRAEVPRVVAGIAADAAKAAARHDGL